MTHKNWVQIQGDEVFRGRQGWPRGCRPSVGNVEDLGLAPSRSTSGISKEGGKGGKKVGGGEEGRRKDGEREWGGRKGSCEEWTTTNTDECQRMARRFPGRGPFTEPSILDGCLGAGRWAATLFQELPAAELIVQNLLGIGVGQIDFFSWQAWSHSLSCQPERPNISASEGSLWEKGRATRLVPGERREPCKGLGFLIREASAQFVHPWGK